MRRKALTQTHAAVCDACSGGALALIFSPGGSGHNADANLEEAARSTLFLPFVEERASLARTIYSPDINPTRVIHSPVSDDDDDDDNNKRCAQ